MNTAHRFTCCMPAARRAQTRRCSVPYGLPFLPIGMPYSTQRPAQPAVPADRCAHKIVGILTRFAMRLRQLNANPLGGCYAVP